MTAVNTNLSGFRPNTNKEKFAFSGAGQYTSQRVNDITQSTKVVSVSGETLTLSAGAAGTTGKVRIGYAPVMDTIGGKLGYYNSATDSDTSLSISHLALAGNHIRFDEYLTDIDIYALLANGDYTIDHTNAILYYKKGTADTAGTATYKYTSQDVNVSADFEIGKVEIKNAVDDTTAKVGVGSSAAVGDNAVYVADANVKTALTNKTQMTKITDGTNETTVVVQDAAFGTASKGLPLFGKYQATPTTYTDGDAAPVLLDTNGRIVLSSDIQIGAVELKNATDDTRAVISAANTARSTATPVLAVQTIDASGNVGGGYLPMVQSATDWSPNYLTATYLSATTLTAAGSRFTVDDSNCEILSITVVNSSGVRTRYINGYAGISISSSANTITITGAGATPFLNTDLKYQISISYIDIGKDITTDTIKTTNLNQPFGQGTGTPEMIISTTNIAAATNYYPSSTGMLLQNNQHIIFDGCSGGVTTTYEIAYDSAFTQAIDITKVTLDTGTNTTNNASYIDANGKAIAINDMKGVYFRIKSVTSDTSNVISYYRASWYA